MMTKRDYAEFQRRTEPLAFLITFRCYGAWLHGDERHGTPYLWTEEAVEKAIDYVINGQGDEPFEL
jgi:hypothetical protein